MVPTAVLAAWLGSGWRVPWGGSRQILAATLAAGATYALLFGFVLPSLAPMWVSPRLADAFEAAKPCANSVLASTGFREPSLVVLAGGDTVLTDGPGAARHLDANPECAVAAVEAADLDAFVAHLAGGAESVVDLGTVDGLNYTNGRQVVLNLFRRTAPADGAS